MLICPTKRSRTLRGARPRSPDPPCGFYRISFTGELSYEVHADARHAAAIWDALIAAGDPFDLTPYGTEAMHVLRAEKGYIIVGQDTDGTACPDDLGLSWAVAGTKPDFIGKRSLARPEMRLANRKQLVGLLPEAVLQEGAQITLSAGDDAMLGHVTSSYSSPADGRPFALAMVAGGRSRIATSVCARAGGRATLCQVVNPVFYDPAGERLNG